MSMMVSFVLSFFPRDVLDEILNLIESVSEDFPSYSYCFYNHNNEPLFSLQHVGFRGFNFCARFLQCLRKSILAHLALRKHSELLPYQCVRRVQYVVLSASSVNT